MSLIDSATQIYERWFWIIVYFTLFGTIVLEAFAYFGYNVYPPGMARITWGTDTLSSAIETLQKGLNVNIIVAIPQIIISIGLILVQVLLNAILLVNWLINLFLQVLFMLVLLPEKTAQTISAVLAWILEAPLIIGMVYELGRLIFNLLPFGGGGG